MHFVKLHFESVFNLMCTNAGKMVILSYYRVVFQDKSMHICNAVVAVLSSFSTCHAHAFLRLHIFKQQLKKMEWNQRNNEIIRSLQYRCCVSHWKWLELNYRCTIISPFIFPKQDEMRMCTTQQFLALAPFKHLFAFMPSSLRQVHTLLTRVCAFAALLLGDSLAMSTIWFPVIFLSISISA